MNAHATRSIPDYEQQALARKAWVRDRLATADDANILPGRRNQLRQRTRLASGRLAWVQTVQTFAALAQFDQADRNQRREERRRPKVLGALAIKVDDATGEQIVLSERRREHWPEPALRTPSYNHARLAETDAIRARQQTVQNVKRTVSRWKSRLFS